MVEAYQETVQLLARPKVDGKQSSRHNSGQYPSMSRRCPIWKNKISISLVFIRQKSGEKRDNFSALPGTLVTKQRNSSFEIQKEKQIEKGESKTHERVIKAIHRLGLSFLITKLLGVSQITYVTNNKLTAVWYCEPCRPRSSSMP